MTAPAAEAATLVRVPIRSVIDYIDPFECPPWGCVPFSVRDVADAVMDGRFRRDPLPTDAPTRDHVERIAWLVVHGWDPTVEPVEFDVGVPGGPWGGDWWPVLDGNHRVCAAIVRGDEWLDCQLSGSWDECLEVFGIYPDGSVCALTEQETE